MVLNHIYPPFHKTPLLYFTASWHCLIRHLRLPRIAHKPQPLQTTKYSKPLIDPVPPPPSFPILNAFHALISSELTATQLFHLRLGLPRIYFSALLSLPPSPHLFLHDLSTLIHAFFRTTQISYYLFPPHRHVSKSPFAHLSRVIIRLPHRCLTSRVR